MFKSENDKSYVTILYAIGLAPLKMWEMAVKNGHIKRVNDPEIQSSAIELIGANVNNNYISCPSDLNSVLGIQMPLIVLQMKNLKKYFAFEVLIIDDKNVKRRFRATNFQTSTRIKPFICTLPMKLDDGWNQVHINLADFTKKAFGTNYVETLR